MTYTNWINFAQLPHHQQDNNRYCGEACIQMAVHALTTGTLGTPPEDQNVYDGFIPSALADGLINWYTAPQNLVIGLNTYIDAKYADFPRRFELHCYPMTGSPPDPAAISRAIVWHIEQYGKAPIVLVGGFQHWLLVRGYQSDQQPASTTDTAYTITSFFVADPGPELPQPTTAVCWPEPHDDSCDQCGVGPLRGQRSQHVTYATWSTTYMTGVPADSGSACSGNFLMITDSLDKQQYSGGPAQPNVPACGCETPPPALLENAPAAITQADTNLPIDEQLLDDGDLRKQAIAGAQCGIEDFKLTEIGDWHYSLPDTTPDAPYRVQYLDRTGRFYYLVPFKKKGLTSVAVKVYGPSSIYEASVAVAATDISVIEILNVDQIPMKLSGREFLYRGSTWSIGREDVIADPPPQLVWQFCHESSSPFYPFYEVHVRLGSGEAIVYMRASDGATFTELSIHYGGD